ncbi:complement C1q-like protein 2, partial [Saccostrea cucullata]|uniref:complement C1q-like protein 2 n=1 Tax=Saccostrea cuccullata TaxID=36930 RepID=UPI002ED04F90
FTEKEIVAFQARANTRQVGIPKHHTVKFGLVITNIGGGYNNNTGQFTAPVKGVYFFDWTMVVDNGDMFFTELVKNGNIVGYNHCAARRHSFEKSCTATARIELQMGDKVWVRTSSFGSDAHSVWPTFGGHKL